MLKLQIEIVGESREAVSNCAHRLATDIVMSDGKTFDHVGARVSGTATITHIETPEPVEETC